MKATFDLPEELVRQLKLRAVRRRQKLKDLAAEILRAGLAAADRQSSRNGKPLDKEKLIIRKDRKSGLPVVQCSKDAPARHMTVEELLELEHATQQREDLERLGIPLR
jgi:plasmid stability protein